jgi:HEAT repeat protein
MMQKAAKEQLAAKEGQLAAKANFDNATCALRGANAAMEAAKTDYAAKEKLATSASSKWQAAKVLYTSGIFHEQAALTSLATAIIQTFKDPDRDVREQAVHALSNLGQTTLVAHTRDIIHMFNDTYQWVRHRAVQAIGKLNNAALAGHAHALAGMLRDPQPFVIQEAVKALAKLDTAELTPHAGAIVQLLGHSEVTLHHAATDALRKLDREALAPHAIAIVSFLTDTDWVTRFEALKALGKLHPDELASHSDDILNLLHDAHWMVRVQASKVTIILEEAQIAMHAHSIVTMLTHGDADVRRGAFELVARKLAAQRFKMVAGRTDAKRAPEEALALVISAIASMLTNGEFIYARYTAILTLRALKKMLAQMHWATARVYRPLVRSYGTFWYEEACKTLCAPGGKWAETDRAAFEEEFG